ncbi:hypothetical protein MPSEU_000606900 [Mayamaea pseudoterrestris]|nr:hypothetical protein MPSEU_000606900 [Mayamaea pseudoterrestris]
MLLWIPQNTCQHHNGDDDEKSTKVQRQARVRTIRTTLACFGASVMVFLVMILQLRLYKSENGAYEPNLRRRRLPYNSIYRLSVMDAQGQSTSLERFAGMDQYANDGFSVLAFPTNDYQQELASNAEVAAFVKEHYPETTFPIFGLGPLSRNPVYSLLSKQLDLPEAESRVRHNFYKYLVDRNGVAVKLYNKKQDPLSIKGAIEKLLKQTVAAL